MAKPYAKANEIQNVLAVAFVLGTDNHIHLTSAAGFPTGGGYVRVGTTTRFCLLEYTGVSTNDLTGITPCTLGTVVSVGDETGTWAIGQVVSREAAAEDFSADNLPAIPLTALATQATDTIVANVTAGTAAPTADLAVAEQRVVGRITGGHIAALTAAQVSGILGTFTTAAKTLYVAKTGNDADGLTYGGTAAHPFLTIGAALDYLPVVLAHACVVNVAPGEYDEILTTKLSRFLIPASLLIEAKDTADRVWHARGNIVDHDATHCGVVDAHVVDNDEWNGAFISLFDGTGSGQIREITDTVATGNQLTVATWDTHPDTDTEYVLWGAVKIDGTSATGVYGSGLRNVTFKGIDFKVSGASTYGFQIEYFSGLTLEDCGAVDNTYGFQVNYNSTASFSYCSVRVPAASYGLWLAGNSYASLVHCVIYGAKSTDVGLYCSNGAIAGMSSSVSQMRHLATGAKAINGGAIFGLGLVYTDNTANISPTTAWTSSQHLDVLDADGMAYIQDRA